MQGNYDCCISMTFVHNIPETRYFTATHTATALSGLASAILPLVASSTVKLLRLASSSIIAELLTGAADCERACGWSIVCSIALGAAAGHVGPCDQCSIVDSSHHQQYRCTAVRSDTLDGACYSDWPLCIDGCAACRQDLNSVSNVICGA